MPCSRSPQAIRTGDLALPDRGVTMSAMSFRALASLAVVALLVGVGCSKADVSMQNDLKGAPPVVAKGGVPDDSVKPKTLTGAGAPVVAKGGVPDDGVKPSPAPLPLPARGGVPDDGVKPATPRPAPPKP